MLAQSTICPCCLYCPLLPSWPSNPQIFSKMYMLPCCLKRIDDAKSNDCLKDSAKPCHLFAFWLGGVLANLQVGPRWASQEARILLRRSKFRPALHCHTMQMHCFDLHCFACSDTTHSTKHPEIVHGINFVDGFPCRLFPVV